MTARRTAILALAAAAALLGGCGAGAGGDSAADFAKLFAGYGADYEHVDAPAALVEKSTLVVQGRIIRVDRGRIIGSSATDPAASPSVVVVLRVGRVLHGTLPARAGDAVYVELPVPRNVKADVFDRAAPKRGDAVLYLAQAPTPADTPIVDPDAGRPAGQPLYQPVSPQAFVIESGPDVVQILMYTVFDSTTLRDFVPGAPHFPHGPSHGH